MATVNINDSDFEVRYTAAVGLAQVTGQDSFICSEEFFKENEKRILHHWQEWAESQR